MILDTRSIENDWPFDQPRNCAVFTTRQILEGAPILHVSHDLDDQGWQFHAGNNVQVKDAKVVALEEIIKRDPSVLDLYDMPPGWFATRESTSEVWKRTQDSSS